MARIIRVAAAQMGATHRTDERDKILGRILELLHEASQKGAEVVLFPEIAFTTVGVSLSVAQTLRRAIISRSRWDGALFTSGLSASMPSDRRTCMIAKVVVSFSRDI